MPIICLHLDDANESWDYAKSFSGIGREYALVCLACAAFPATIEPNLRSVSTERFTEIEQDGYWEREPNAIIGRPEILERPETLSFRHEEVLPPGSLPETIADLKPVPTSRPGECLILTEAGDLLIFNPREPAIRPLQNILDAGPNLTPRWSLRVSPRGEMTAITEARGRHGFVLDLESGLKTMDLDRGAYHPEQTEFPVAFFESSGHLRLVHGTAFDSYLFSSSAEAGTSVWDIASGERVLHDASFNPTCFHPGSKEFLTLTPCGGIRLSQLVGA